MDRIRARVTLLLIFITLSLSCARAPVGEAEPGDSSLQRVISQGELRVGYLVWDPCVRRDERTGTLTGIYPRMIEAIADAVGVEVSWHESSLANFRAGLTSRQFDVFVGAVFITIPRATSASYTKPIAYIGNSGVVRQDGDFRPESISDLDRPGIRIATLQGQAMEEFIKRRFPRADLLVLSGGDLTAPLAAVSAGRADIGLMNAVTVMKYAGEHEEVVPVLTDANQIEVLPLAWAVRHEDDDLRSFLDSAIEYLQATGRVQEYQGESPIKLLYRNQRFEVGH